MNIAEWRKQNLNLHVRSAEQLDATYLMDIDVKCFHNVWEPEKWREIARTKDIVCVTAFSVPIAFAVYEIESVFAGPRKLKILRFAVTPKYQRRNIGTMLMTWLKRLAEDRTIQKVTTIVSENNMPGCLFAKAMGFRVPLTDSIIKDAFEEYGSLLDGYYFIYDSRGTNV